MTQLRIAAPKSLAAAPLILLAAERPGDYELHFFTDHDLALADLRIGKVDVLCTGHREMERLPEIGRPHRLATFVWGLSAVMVREPGIKNLVDLARVLNKKSGEALTLPFAESPLDLEIRALLRKLLPGKNMPLANAPLLQTFASFQDGKIAAAVLPEPMATALEMSGEAFRLADVAELQRQATGRPYSPQVALFMGQEKNPPPDFMAQFEESILRIRLAAAADLRHVADGLAIGQAALERALSHAIFELPAAEEVKAREEIYAALLAGKLN
ncbi:MAG: hypothetical protein U1F27_15830 [Turneriella sp.]